MRRQSVAATTVAFSFGSSSASMTRQDASLIPSPVGGSTFDCGEAKAAALDWEA